MRPIEYRPIMDVFATSVHIEEAGDGVVRMILGVEVDGEVRAVASVVMPEGAARRSANAVLSVTDHGSVPADR